MTIVLFGVIRVTHAFLFHKHRKRTKKVLMHGSTVLMAVDCLKAIGLIFGGEAVDHMAHVCGATGALFGAFACYLED
jgi:hypothetical protein